MVVSAFQAFSERETTLTGGSRRPAKVVAAHSGLFVPAKILHWSTRGSLAWIPELRLARRFFRRTWMGKYHR